MSAIATQRPAHYRPDIDGLRALAVIPVLLFHLGLSCPGGYVGVDVFFVISGFLITSIILREIAAGTFTLSAFWVRRIRRILPSLVRRDLGNHNRRWVRPLSRRLPPLR